MEEKILTCIQCPLGCALTVTVENGKVVEVKGHTCKRGAVYGEKEVTNPTRTVTSTVKVLGGALPVLPVKTSGDIPKGKIFDCMQEINRVTVNAPVSIGDVIIKGVCGTSADVIATADCMST